jgi:serpin B
MQRSHEIDVLHVRHAVANGGKALLRISWMIAVAAALILGACGDPSEPDDQIPREAVRTFTAQEASVADASVGFGLLLYQQVSAHETEPNVLVSPLSASMALGMTMNGAQGDTYNAMRSTLGFGSMPELEVNEAYRGLIAQLLARDTKVTFKLANSIWHENSLPVREPFLAAARSYFDAEVTGLNFGDPNAPKTISAWAERETNGRIKDLVKQIDANEVMFLVNAVYFKAPWSNQFDPGQTRNGSFTRADGSTVTVPLMHRDGAYRWLQNEQVTALELPYGDSAFSMVLVMPGERSTLGELEQNLNTSWWTSTLSALASSRVLLTMPKFKFEFGEKLNDALEELGMGIAFDRTRADFYRIASVEPERLYISRVEQKTFIAVDETGTEAAAATSVGIGVTSLPPSVTFDRPFLFAIRERESGTLLFIGRMGDPTRS